MEMGDLVDSAESWASGGSTGVEVKVGRVRLGLNVHPQTSWAF